MPEFETVAVTVDGVTIRGERAGHGPPVLLLHGIPETRRMWRHVSPVLARTHTVVATDLRGYGESDTAVGASPDHSMRTLAAEQVAVMRELGYERFAVVGHDRGARCAYRMALDFPEVVTALAVMDVVPTAEAFARADREFALGYWVWSLLAAPAPVPETLIGGAPGTLVDHMLDEWSDAPEVFDEQISRALHRDLPRPGPRPCRLRAVPRRRQPRRGARRGRPRQEPDPLPRPGPLERHRCRGRLVRTPHGLAGVGP